MVTPLVLMVGGAAVVAVKVVVVALVWPFRAWRVPVPVPGRVRRAGGWLAAQPVFRRASMRFLVAVRAGALAVATGLGMGG